MAQSMLSFGTEVFLAFCTASTSVGLPDMSAPPVFAATSMFLMSLANDFARRESITAFLCLVVAHLECPDTGAPSNYVSNLTIVMPRPVARRSADRSARRERPMHGRHGAGAFTDRSRDALHRAVAHIPRGEDSGDARLERERAPLLAVPGRQVDIGEEEAARVDSDTGQPLRLRLRADEA